MGGAFWVVGSVALTVGCSETVRFLRASKWKTQVAIQRLESTLKWRREYGIYDLITKEHISIEVSKRDFHACVCY